MTIAALARFLKNPVKDFFRARLDVVFRDADEAAEDDEAFDLDGLQEYTLLDATIKAVLLDLHDLHDEAGPAADLRRLVTDHVERLHRAGRLPMAEPGRRSARVLADALVPMLAQWCRVRARYVRASVKQPVHFAHDGLVLDDWLAGSLPEARHAGLAGHAGLPAWLELTPGRLCAAGMKAVRPDRLLVAWVRMLAGSASGVPVQGVIVGRDATVTVDPLAPGEAQTALAVLMDAWREGRLAPLPLASKTALARAAGAPDEVAVYEGNSFARAAAGPGPNAKSSGEVEEPCLARMFPDHEALTADGRFAELAERLFGPLLAWARTHVTFEPHEPHEPPEPQEMQAPTRPALAQIDTDA